MTTDISNFINSTGCHFEVNFIGVQFCCTFCICIQGLFLVPIPPNNIILFTSLSVNNIYIWHQQTAIYKMNIKFLSDKVLAKVTFAPLCYIYVHRLPIKWKFLLVWSSLSVFAFGFPEVQNWSNKDIASVNILNFIVNFINPIVSIVKFSEQSIHNDYN